jgi:predicted transposase/invertase (TIGR01784 family)
MLDPKIDVVFRKLFGSEENKECLISLINSVVNATSPIVDVTIKNPFNLAAYRGAKESILDIKAVDQSGVWYDIEMQIEAHVLYGRRALYYLSKTYADQLETGEDYSKLNTTIGIHFLDFRYFDDDRIVRQFVFQDTDTGHSHKELCGLRLYFIEMGKFDLDWPQIRTALDRWIAFLNRASSLERSALPAPLAAEPALVRAAAQLERMGLNAEERGIYEGEVKRRMVDAIQIRSAEERGEARGEARGETLGIRDTILRIGSRRFGDPTPEIIREIEAVTSAVTLQSIADRLLEVENWKDLLASG